MYTHINRSSTFVPTHLLYLMSDFICRLSSDIYSWLTKTKNKCLHTLLLHNIITMHVKRLHVHPPLCIKSTDLSLMTSLVAFCGCNLNWQAQLFCMHAANIKDWVNPLWFPAAVTHSLTKSHKMFQNQTARHHSFDTACYLRLKNYYPIIWNYLNFFCVNHLRD